MKKLIIILISLLCSQWVMAQPGTIKMDTTIIEKDGEKVIIIKPAEGQDITTPADNQVKVQVESTDQETGETDTTVINVGGVQVIIKEKDKKEHEEQAEKEELRIQIGDDEDNSNPTKKRLKTRWILLDVGLLNYLDNSNLDINNSVFELNQGKSWDVNLHLFRQRVSFARNHMSLMYGVAFDFNIYNFNHNSTLIADTNVVAFRTPDAEVNYSKNKFRTTYMDIPVTLNFNTNPRKSSKSVRIGLGAYGGMLVGAVTKQKSSKFGKVKERDNYNAERFRYGVYGDLGIGPINLYAKYQLSNLFDNNPIGSLQPLSFGIKVIPF